MTRRRERTSAGSSEPALSLYAEFEALEGAIQQVRDLLAELIVAVRAEPGNLVFNAWTRHKRPDEFVVFETYRDRSAFEAHITAPHSVTFNRHLSTLVRGGRSRLTWVDPV